MFEAKPGLFLIRLNMFSGLKYILKLRAFDCQSQKRAKRNCQKKLQILFQKWCRKLQKTEVSNLFSELIQRLYVLWTRTTEI